MDFEILKTFGKKRFLSWIVNQLIFLYLVCLVTLNLLKFKKANVIFVNSYAFGHSVIETSVFFHEYGQKGVCISVGSRSNRNKYLKFLYTALIANRQRQADAYLQGHRYYY